MRNLKWQLGEKMNPVKTAGLTVLLFFFIGTGSGFPLDPNIPVDKYIHKNWSSRDGLPHNTVTAIIEDKTGYIWLGTENGLARFDGNNFEIFNTNDTKRLKSNSITSLLVSSNNKLWIGTDGGGISVYTFHRKVFDRYSTENGLPSNIIRSIAEDKQKKIWIGTYGGGLVRFDPLNSRIFTTKDGLSDNRINRIFCDSKGTLWIGTEKGLTCFRNNRFSIFTEKDGLPCNQIYALNEDKNLKLWVGTGKGITLVKLVENQTLSRLNVIPSPGFAGDYRVDSILEDNGNVTWIASDNGLKRAVRSQNGYKIETVSSIGGSSFKHPVLSLYRDKMETLWIGTAGYGLDRLQNSHFTYYTRADGLSSDYTRTIYEDDKGIVWIGTKTSGLNRLENGKFTVYTKNEGLPGNDVTALSQDEEGNLWVGTTTGLKRFGLPMFNEIPIPGGPVGDSISALYKDTEGTLWIGTWGNGLKEYRKGKFYTLDPRTSDKDFTRKTVLCMAANPFGDLWIGTDEGLYFLEDDRLKPFKGKERLSKYMIADINIDIGGILWLGTDTGLIYFDSPNNTVIPYPGEKESEFSCARIYKILEDFRNNLWISSNRGIFCISKKSFNPSVSPEDIKSSPMYYHFLESDGLMVSTFTGGSQPAGCKTRDKNMWFPSMEGIVVIDPTQAKLENVSIPVTIDKIAADGVPVVPGPGEYHVFPEKTGKIEFYFSALNMGGLENMKFKCLLKCKSGSNPISREDILDSAQKKIAYSELPYGSYRFSVSAGNEDKGWGKEAVSCEFSLGSGFSTLEQILLLLIIILAIVTVVIFKIVEQRKKEKEMMRIFKEDSRYKTSAMDPKIKKKCMMQILTLMEKEKLYLDPDMSISKMAQRIGISKEYISQIINQQFYMNFNQFLNKYRVEEAGKRLKDPKENQFVVLKIGYDVGFNSKSTFNSSFKKFTGMSPCEYREKYQEQKGSNAS